MKLISALRFKPFSHLPGTCCFLPGSKLILQIYPTKLLVSDGLKSTEVNFSYRGFMKQFTVTLDLESYAIVVGGFTEGGYLRYEIRAGLSGFLLKILKQPDGFTYCHRNESSVPIAKPERERLSLGVAKAQDVEMIFRRQDIREIVPFLYYLAQSIPGDIKGCEIPQDCLDAQKNLCNMALIGFKSIFVPRIEDEQFVGALHPLMQQGMTPQSLLKNTFFYIRQLLFQEIRSGFSFLPLMPPQFHCGRLIGLQSQKGHYFSFEWTKKKMRRLICVPAEDDEASFHFSSNNDTFRMEKKGEKIILGNGTRISLKKDIPLLLDNFQK